MLGISSALLALEEMDGEVTLLALFSFTVVVMMSALILLLERGIVYLAVKSRDLLAKLTKFTCMGV